MKDPKLSEIRDLALFRDCRPADIRWIAGVADIVDVPAERKLVSEGRTAREFVVLVNGSASVSDGAGSVAMAPGAYFGHVGLVDGSAHAATIQTSAPTRLLVFTPGAFRGLLERVPSVGRKLLAGVVADLRSAVQEPRSLRAVS